MYITSRFKVSVHHVKYIRIHLSLCLRNMNDHFQGLAPFMYPMFVLSPILTNVFVFVFGIFRISLRVWMPSLKIYEYIQHVSTSKDLSLPYCNLFSKRRCYAFFSSFFILSFLNSRQFSFYHYNLIYINCLEVINKFIISVLFTFSN